MNVPLETSERSTAVLPGRRLQDTSRLGAIYDSGAGEAAASQAGLNPTTATGVSNDGHVLPDVSRMVDIADKEVCDLTTAKKGLGQTSADGPDTPFTKDPSAKQDVGAPAIRRLPMSKVAAMAAKLARTAPPSPTTTRASAVAATGRVCSIGRWMSLACSRSVTPICPYS